MSLYTDALWYGGAKEANNVTVIYNHSIAPLLVANEIKAMFQAISVVTNLSFSIVRYALPSFPNTSLSPNFDTRSYAYYPNSGSDVFLSKYHYLSNGVTLSDHSPGTFNYVDLLHETLHTLGLQHVHVADTQFVETSALTDLRANFTYFCGDGTVTYPADNLNRAWMTCMSYDYGYNSHAVTPMILDVITLGEMYGITNKNIGDTIYSAANGNFLSGFYSTIVDTGGVDTVDMSSQIGSMFINLGVDVGATYQVGIVTTTAGWIAMHTNGDVVLNSESLMWLYGTIENGTGGSGSDTIIGNDVANILNGGNGNDTITGNGGNDAISGGIGADLLNGGIGNDTVNGGNGNDMLYGSLGNDTLTGGSGADHFVFNTALNATTNKDTITDLVSGTDKIDLSLSAMPALGVEGNLANIAFYSTASGITGHDTDDRIIYNTSTGALYYDADGTGAAAAIQIAIIGITSHPTINYMDFNIVV